MDFTNQLQVGKIIAQLRKAGVYKEEFNLVGLEGVKFKGGKFTLTDDKPDQWNDCFIVISYGKIVDALLGTTEPSRHYTIDPMNPRGAARLAFGSYKDVYIFGVHGVAAPHNAFVQVGNLTVCRDLNKDFIRTGDKRFTGNNFAVNFHSTPSGANENSIGYWSAGCQVVYLYDQFVQLLKRAKASGLKRFSYSLFDGEAALPGSVKPLVPAGYNDGAAVI